MDEDEKQEKYEDYIKTLSAAAAAAGRREPYHLTFIKKYKEIIPVPEEQAKEKTVAGSSIDTVEGEHM